MKALIDPYLGALKAAAVVAGLLFVFHVGGKIKQAEWDRASLEAEKSADRDRFVRQEKIYAIDTKGAARAKNQAVADQTILLQVEKHVPITLPMLPGSFRLQHDAAATGKEIDDSSPPDADPVAPRTVATTTARNYISAREDKANLEELQAIIRASGCFDISGD